MDRLPLSAERIVRKLMEAAPEGEGSSIGVDGNTVVRLLEWQGEIAKLRCVIVEEIRMRDPLQEAALRFGITRRETEVLRLVLLGASTAAIARRLQIAETTAYDHVKHIAIKTASGGRREIVAHVLGFL
jgi:DNA-binding CsgD family transcriptional regulator